MKPLAWASGPLGSNPALPLPGCVTLKTWLPFLGLTASCTELLKVSQDPLERGSWRTPPQ